MAYFKVNGFNVLPYIEAGGLKWSENDIDSPQAGRTMDGLMHRGKVESKIKYEFKCWPLVTSEANIVINALQTEYVDVETDIDPKNGTVAYQMYNSSRNSSCYVIDPSTGIGKWHDLSFNLIQR